MCVYTSGYTLTSKAKTKRVSEFFLHATVLFGIAPLQKNKKQCKQRYFHKLHFFEGFVPAVFWLKVSC